MSSPVELGVSTTGSHRIATIPNALSIARLVVVAVALVVLFRDRNHVLAAWLLIIGGSTDFLDGQIARRFNQVSELGKVLDPTVDRIALGASAISIVVFGAVPVWLAVIVLVREALVGTATLVLAALGARRIEVIFVGKAGAFGLMTALPAFLMSDGPGATAHDLRLAAWWGIALALALAYAALVAYVPKARAALALGRAARVSDEPV